MSKVFDSEWEAPHDRIVAAMKDYNFWADLLDTFQSSADWIKALWLAMPPAFVLALVWLFRWRVGRANAVDTIGGELLYTVYKEPNGLIQIYRHGDLDDGNSESVLIEHQLGADMPRLG